MNFKKICVALSIFSSICFGAFTLTDNMNTSAQGIFRNITIVSDGQIQLGFMGELHGSIANIYDLVNDPLRTTALCDTTSPARAQDESVGFGAFGHVDYSSHNGYEDQCVGNEWPVIFDTDLASSPLKEDVIRIEVLEDNNVRKKVRVSTYFMGYGGNGLESHWNMDHEIENVYTIYPNGAIFISSTDYLNTYNSSSTGNKVTYILLGVNSSLGNYRVAAGGEHQWEAEGEDGNVPWGLPPAPWIAQYGHPDTKLNIMAAEYGDHSVPFTSDGKWSANWIHKLAAGNRFGWSAWFEGHPYEAGTVFKKSYYLQFGTEGADHMPDFAMATDSGARCAFDVGDAYAYDYLEPATLNAVSGSIVGDGYNEDDGVYTLEAQDGVVEFFMEATSRSRYNPRFHIQNSGKEAGVSMFISGNRIASSNIVTDTTNGNILLQFYGEIHSTAQIRIETNDDTTLSSSSDISSATEPSSSSEIISSSELLSSSSSSLTILSSSNFSSSNISSSLESSSSWIDESSSSILLSSEEMSSMFSSSILQALSSSLTSSSSFLLSSSSTPTQQSSSSEDVTSIYHRVRKPRASFGVIYHTGGNFNAEGLRIFSLLGEVHTGNAAAGIYYYVK